jgi:hypothetical protein
MSLLAMMSCARGKIQQKNGKKQWKKCSLWSEEASSLMKSAHILSFFSTIFDNIHHSFRVSCARVSKQRQERLVSCFFRGKRSQTSKEKCNFLGKLINFSCNFKRKLKWNFNLNEEDEGNGKRYEFSLHFNVWFKMK